MKKIGLLLLLAGMQLLAFTQPYERIISLSPAHTFNLMELGCEDKIVGVTSYCDLADKEDLVVGSAVSMNMEKVLLLKPDLVIYTTMFKPNEITRLKQLGIHCELFESPDNFQETCAEFLRLGKLVDKEERAKQYVDSCVQEMQQVQAQIPKGEQPKIFMEIGASPLFCAIPGTFMHDYIEIMGGVNIAKGQKHGTISREAVIRANPDVVVIVTMGMVSEREKETWESFPNLSATKKENIFVVDASLACRPTPYNFVNTIKVLNDLLYGE